jgi:hypothetical protein
MICWNNLEEKVMEGLISTNNYNPSNCITHILNMHKKEDAPAIKFREDSYTYGQSKHNFGDTSTVATKKQYGTPGKYACKEANSILYKFVNSELTMSTCMSIHVTSLTMQVYYNPKRTTFYFPDVNISSTS